MKNQFIIPWFSITFLILMTIACTRSNNNQNLPKPPNGAVDKPTPMDSVLCQDSCAFVDSNSFRISQECAICSRYKYESNWYTFPKYNGSEVRGFKIEQDELREILDTIANDQAAEVFAMMGIGDSLDVVNNKVINIPELIFVVRKFDKTTKSEKFTYYDFTRPCPDLCPGDGF